MKKQEPLALSYRCTGIHLSCASFICMNNLNTVIFCIYFQRLIRTATIRKNHFKIARLLIQGF